MSEERLVRMETMLADLIRIVGSTNAMVGETRDDLRILQGKVDVLEGKLNGLQEEVGTIKIDMATREDIQHINWGMDLHMGRYPGRKKIFTV